MGDPVGHADRFPHNNLFMNPANTLLGDTHSGPNDGEIPTVGSRIFQQFYFHEAVGQSRSPVDTGGIEKASQGPIDHPPEPTRFSGVSPENSFKGGGSTDFSSDSEGRGSTNAPIPPSFFLRLTAMMNLVRYRMSAWNPVMGQQLPPLGPRQIIIIIHLYTPMYHTQVFPKGKICQWYPPV